MNNKKGKSINMKGLLLLLYVMIYVSFSFSQNKNNQSEKDENEFLLERNLGNLAPVKKNNKIGFINSEGKIVADYFYDDNLMTRYHFNEDEGFIFVKRDNKAGLLDQNGKVVISPFVGYDEIGIFNQISESEYYSIFYLDGFCPVKKNNKWGFVNLKGEEVLKCQFESVKPVKNGIFAFCENKKWGIKDLKGKTIIDPLFDEVSDFDIYSDASWKGYFSSGFCPVAQLINEELYWGYVNMKNQLVIPHKYQQVGRFNDEGLAVIHTQETCGCINIDGKVIKTLEFDYAESDFHEGMAVVSKNSKYGFINTMCNIAIPIEFDYAGGFVNGLSAVVKNGRHFYINKKGEITQAQNE
jgi:hypothetical protein